MTFLVPYDASDLADAALERAATLGGVTDTPVVAMTVIPRGDTTFAQERDLIDDAPADLETVVAALRDRVAAVAPDASFEYEAVGRYAPPGEIATRLKSRAREDDVAVVVVGSENAGRYVASLSSVGRSVAASTAYDVFIVRRTTASTLDPTAGN